MRVFVSMNCNGRWQYLHADVSRTLGELEENGLALRREFKVILLHVEYSLTHLEKALTPALDTLGAWGHKVWLANGSPTAPNQFKRRDT